MWPAGTLLEIGTQKKQTHTLFSGVTQSVA